MVIVCKFNTPSEHYYIDNNDTYPGGEYLRFKYSKTPALPRKC